MVKLLIKRNEEEQFLYETDSAQPVSTVTQQITQIYNGRLKIRRMIYHMEELAKHGTCLPPNMQGLTDEQIRELKLHDQFAEKHAPCGGTFIETPDGMGKRNGRAPSEAMQTMLKNTMDEAKQQVSKQLVQLSKPLSLAEVRDAYNKLKGAVTIVYPMGLPAHDPLAFDLTRFDVGPTDDTYDQKDIIEERDALLWFCGKQLVPAKDKRLADYIGQNEKCKVILKITRKTAGPPAREDVFTEQQKKEMMMHAYRRQEELKQLHTDDDDNYLNSAWANPAGLKQSLHNLSDIKFRM